MFLNGTYLFILCYVGLKSPSLPHYQNSSTANTSNPSMISVTSPTRLLAKSLQGQYNTQIIQYTASLPNYENNIHV